MRIAILLLVAVLAWAANAYTACPYDGESAYFDGERNGSSCEYRHLYADRRSGQTTEHVFWAGCGD
jgi:hypothetical protein